MEQLKVDLETSAMAYQEIEGLSQAIIQFKAEMDQYFQQIEQKPIANRYLPSSEIYAYMNKYDESIINSYRLFHFFEELQVYFWLKEKMNSWNISDNMKINKLIFIFLVFINAFYNMNYTIGILSRYIIQFSH